MQHVVTLFYPDPGNNKRCLFILSVFKLGNYLMSGRSEHVIVPVDYAQAGELADQLYTASKYGHQFVITSRTGEKYTIDQDLINEMFGAVSELIVDVELGPFL